MEWSLVQILVTVAIIQMEYLRIEVEKGFRWTMFGPELVDPNVEINFDDEFEGYSKEFDYNLYVIWQVIVGFSCITVIDFEWLDRKGNDFNHIIRVEYSLEGQPNNLMRDLAATNRELSFLDKRSWVINSLNVPRN